MYFMKVMNYIKIMMNIIKSQNDLKNTAENKIDKEIKENTFRVY